MTTVSMRALIGRINRKLDPSRRLQRTRSQRDVPALGNYFLVTDGRVTDHHVDPETLAREISCLRPWETVVQ